MKRFLNFCLLVIVCTQVNGQLSNELLDLKPSNKLEIPAPQQINFTQDLTNDDRGPGYFGEFIEVGSEYSIENGTALSNGKIAKKISIATQEAKSINLILKNVVLKNNAQIITYNPDFPDYELEYGSENLSKNGSMVSFPIKGNKQDIILVANASNDISFTLEKVVYGRKSSTGFGESGSCNINANCPDANGYRDIQKATVLILVNGNGWCTGTLMNNPTFDCTPYILTAGHCMPFNFDDVENWGFAFNYESPNCNSQNVNPTTYTGAIVKTYDGFNDAALLEMDVIPNPTGGVYYAGYSKVDAQFSAACFHHPSGDIKKFSFDGAEIETTFYDEDPTEHLSWKVRWDKGTTEGGSSGSGLINHEGYIVGTLAGGRASCANRLGADYFARIKDVFEYRPVDNSTSYAPHLDPGYARDESVPGFFCSDPKPALDLAIAGISGVPRKVCNELFNPIVEIYNAGLTDPGVFTVRMTDAMNNNLIKEIMVNTGLAPGEKKSVFLGEVGISSDVYAKFEVSSSGTDLREFNNEGFLNIEFIPGLEYLLEIQLDSFPTENAISIIDQNGNLIDSVKFSEDFKMELFTLPICVIPDQCYTLKVYDNYGDGLCCDYGDGYYKLYDNLGNVLADGWNTDPTPQKAQKETHNFCATSIKQHEIKEVKIFPNPVNSSGRIRVDIPNTNENIEYTLISVTGKTVSGGILTNNTIALPELIPGAYIVLFRDNKETRRARILVE
ncbi:T9SS type A sorting domain-containing protein [Luteibaculum oceani]|uniref:T9SS type A sorting domain-containing protein n=1 Tax=Luteibaculum oceani TaxID=1294296 RepID=A0A5C6UWQ2_9FLAO|nr:T9SS type A sorting domain-containing protein [Luteibaculum oceani]TXC77094.1 T9SS type A sorting domain-containing protein [Luteibaculum oceani]